MIMVKTPLISNPSSKNQPIWCKIDVSPDVGDGNEYVMASIIADPDINIKPENNNDFV